MQMLCFFNNKGGVGKTTLLTNIASFLATRYQLRVLILDLDPQCNTTQLIVPEDRLDELMNDAQGSETILRVLEPIKFGEPSIGTKVPLISSQSNNFGVSLLPGHPSLSLFEDTLSKAWLEMTGGQPAGLRQSLWIQQLKDQLDKKFDIAFIDVGPSIGALNRTILLGADYFVSPLGCDLFSIIGLKNIGQWLTDTQQTLFKSLDRLREEQGDDILARYGLQPEFIRLADFVGYTVLQYITKSKAGVRRPTEAFERFRRQIPEVVKESLGKRIPPQLTPEQCDLGDVPNMYSIVPLAQYAQKPVHLLKGADGLSGAAHAQHKGYVGFIEALSNRLKENLELLPDSSTS